MSKRILKGEKITYRDGVGYTIWEGIKGAKPEDDIGCCFDFAEEQMEDLLALLQDLKQREAEPYTEERKKSDEEHDAWLKENEERDKKWYMRIHSKLRYVGVQFTPFRWGLRFGNRMHFLMTGGGIKLGPLYITW